MISKKEQLVIEKTAKKYKVQKVILFGSSQTNKNYNDIDLAIKGIAPKNFFKFYAELIDKLDKPIDLIDLNQSSKFNTLVVKEGTPIYG